LNQVLGGPLQGKIADAFLSWLILFYIFYEKFKGAAAMSSRVRRLILTIFFVFPITALLQAQANPPSYLNQKEDNFTVKNFKFQSGETLPELKLHYITVGTPHKNAQGEIDNAVLLLHGTTGTGKNFLSPAIGGQLFGPGQPLDATKYYLIMPDGIGRGGSSKPSDGMHTKFPHYGYLDVVEGQYRLVTEGLGIKRLKLVLGTSMGGMQTWLWGEKYPDAMDALMPIASQPIEVSGRNMLWRRLVIEAIRTDPDWNNGD
jgi:homoserine O-acetyltransferase